MIDVFRRHGMTMATPPLLSSGRLTTFHSKVPTLFAGTLLLLVFFHANVHRGIAVVLAEDQIRAWTCRAGKPRRGRPEKDFLLRRTTSAAAAGAHHAGPFGRSPLFVRSKASFWVPDLDNGPLRKQSTWTDNALTVG